MSPRPRAPRVGSIYDGGKSEIAKDRSRMRGAEDERGGTGAVSQDDEAREAAVSPQGVAKYSPRDVERMVPEPPATRRTEFERDRARVLHSAAIRRLADKTQVVGPGDGDIPRTRLTHSLEVAQIARSIGSGLGADMDLCDLAGLAHDIGHPPYGHNGETALAEVAAGCGGFEGNAQTLRILARLEPKVVAEGEGGPVSVGLNLTRAALDAATKYPWTPREGTSKFGAYPEDAGILAWIREGAPGERRALESQIMDYSDDVAYSVHDVEDAILAGRLDMAILDDDAEVTELAALGARHFSDCDAPALERAAETLARSSAVKKLQHYEPGFTGLVDLKAFTSGMVGRFVAPAIEATQERFGPGPHCRYSADLVTAPEVLAEVVLLKTMAVRYVMLDPGHRTRQDRQRDRIHRVADYLLGAAPASLDPALVPGWESAGSDAERLRAVVDQISLYTESRLERIDRQIAGVSAAWG